MQLPRQRHIGELKLYYDQIAKDAERVPASLLMSVWVRSWMPEDSPSFSCVLYVQLHLSDSSADADEESDKLEAAVLLLEEMVFLLFFCGYYAAVFAAQRDGLCACSSVYGQKRPSTYAKDT